MFTVLWQKPHYPRPQYIAAIIFLQSSTPATQALLLDASIIMYH
jgi:hypothetical protein